MTEQKKCFVIMPFGKRGTEEHKRNKKIYELMIKPVVHACGYEPIRSDELKEPGSITKDIIDLLHKADLVIADLSGKNANVFYELGVRHALFRCGTIPIVREGEDLPFDIKDCRAVYYSSELDGPEEFKKELELRIKAFDNMQKDKSDNPVHDVLGDSLQFQIPGEYVPRKSFDEKLSKLIALANQLDALQKQNKQLLLNQKSSEEQITANVTERVSLLKKISRLEQELKQAKASIEQPVVKKETATNHKIFRSEPKTLSSDDVQAILKKFDFFDSSQNKAGRGFANQYKAEIIKGDKVVVEQASSLMWHQGGSPEYMQYEAAKQWVADLSKKGYAGCHDWRLPTLEEAMSLMESKKNKTELYVDPIFDSKQNWIWTCDPIQSASLAWVVSFYDGRCYFSQFDYYNFVRVVRFGQSDKSD